MEPMDIFIFEIILSFYKQNRFMCLFNKISLFQENPCQSHKIIIKCIIWYLKHTKGYGLYYNTYNELPQVLKNANINLGSGLGDCKSQTCFRYTFSSIAIIWGSHKERGLFMSIIVAELVVLVKSTKEIM